MGFLVADGAVLGATRDDNELAGTHKLFAIAKPHAQSAFDDEKEFVLEVVVMPDKFALELDRFDAEVIHFAENFGIPVIGEAGEFLIEIDGVHGRGPQSL